MTSEEAVALYQQGEEAVVTAFLEQAEHHRALEQRLRVLEDKLAPKPHASSSSTSFLKPMSLHPKSGKKSGGQPGHPGSHFKKADALDVDEIIECPPDNLCSYCGARADGGVPIGGFRGR